MNTTPTEHDSAVAFQALGLDLSTAEAGDGGYEDRLREAVARHGGALMFHMRLTEEADARSVAAVAFGSCSDSDIAIVSFGANGSATVEPATDSKLAIAAIAPAFAGLAQCWRPAA